MTDTYTILMQVGGSLVGLGGLAWGIITWVSGQFGKRDDQVRKVQDDLSAHKLHVAETYTTKAGMQEQTAQIMKALDGVSAKIDYTNGRLDTFTQLKPTARTRPT